MRENEPLPVRQFNPKVSRDLEIICLKCLEKDPGKRFGSARELAEDLQLFLDGEPIRGRLPGIAEKTFRLLLRQQFTNVAAWGWIMLCLSVVNTIGYSGQAWAIASAQPNTIHYGILILHALMVPVLFWRGLRGCRLETGDRLLISFGIALIVGLLIRIPLMLHSNPAATTNQRPVFGDEVAWGSVDSLFMIRLSPH